MGITGLIPFLSKSSRRANIKEYSGQAVAIDAYCWLHKGAFSCADKLVMNEPTNVYVMYCMKFVNMLLSHNIKPILVFDGRYLPAKADTESKRRENREINRKKGAELLRAGKTEEGRNYLRRSVDISHQMALQLIKECRNRNVDCIVAPYEADAQLAYLNINNIAQVVITEDSDLLLFGCTRVMFKMDVNGNGIIIEKDKIHVSVEMRPDNFTIDKFRYMCILSGCDYLPSLPGIGLAKACKFIKRVSETDIYEALRKLPCNLNMWTLVITDEYRENFVKADKTFKYQLVYDPIQRKQVPLNEVESSDDIVGKMLDDETAFQLAIGNLDPMTLRKMDDYHPDKAPKKNNFAAKHKSIWSKEYLIKGSNSNNARIQRTSTIGMCITASVTPARKRPNEFESSKAPEQIRDELLSFYGGESKRSASSSESLTDVSPSSPPSPNEKSPPSEINKSPVLSSSRKNPFAVTNKKLSIRRSYLEGLKRFSITSQSEATTSKYFQSSHSPKLKSPERISVLDILEGSKPDSHEVPSETEKTVVSESDDQVSIDSLNESKSSASPVKPFYLDSLERESYEDGIELMKSSQEENILNISNLETSSEELIVGSKFSRFLANGRSVTKNFYESHKNEGLCNVSNNNISEFLESPKKSRSPEKIVIKNTSPIISKFSKSNSKKLSRTGLSQPKKGKQGLLSQFGFQPRPKILSEKKMAS